MQQIKNIVKGPYEPQDNTVIWIDTSNPDAPIAKVHSNGEWKATSGGEIVTEIDKNSTDEQIPSAKAVFESLKTAGEVIEGTWTEIRALRDNGELLPGRLYRITDYEVTSCQIFTSAMGPSPDRPRLQITLIAATNRSFFERGFGFVNNNTYDIWYCIDNDSDRFHWAADTIIWAYGVRIGSCLTSEPLSRESNADLDTGTYRYAWGYKDPNDTFEGYLYTSSESPEQGDTIYNLDTQQFGAINFIKHGKGVIYRMIDSNNNDIGYDFYSIIFHRHKIDPRNITVVDEDFSFVEDFLKFHSVEVVTSDYPKTAEYYSDVAELSDEYYYITLYENSGGYPVLIGRLEEDAPATSEYPYYTLHNYLSDGENSGNCSNVHIEFNSFLPNNVFIGDQYSNIYLDDSSTNNTFITSGNSGDIELKRATSISCIATRAGRVNLKAYDSSFGMVMNGVNVVSKNDNFVIDDSTNINLDTGLDNRVVDCFSVIINSGSSGNSLNSADFVIIESSCMGNYIEGSYVHILPDVAGAEVTESGMWVGTDSNGNLQIWNPADPTGT